MRNEWVDVHSLHSRECGWELRIYQSAQVLTLDGHQKQAAESLRQALDDGKAVRLSWDESTGVVGHVALES